MKTIDQKIINSAIDIFSEMYGDQITEKVAELYKRQEGVFDVTLRTINSFKNKNSRQHLWGLILVLDYCFLNGNKKIGEIKEKSINEKLEWMQKEMMDSVDKNGHIDLFKLALKTEQNQLLHYFTLTLGQFQDEEKFISKDENAQFMITLLLLCFLYTDEINKIAL